MAKMVLLASFLSVDAVDRSTDTSKIELTVEVDEKEATTFGSLGWKEVLDGIKSAQLAVTFKGRRRAGRRARMVRLADPHGRQPGAAP